MTPQLYLFTASLKKFISKHHPVMFITLISLSLAACIALLYYVLVIGNVDESNSASTIEPFNQKAIDRIKDLNISSDTTNITLTLPSPRPNPFVEK